MSALRLRRAFLAMTVAALVAVVPARATPEKPLTNEDVVRLSKLGLGDDVVIAKINQAAEVDFRLETSDLAALKKAGVSSKIIAAMLDRSAGLRAVGTGGGGVIVTPGAIGNESFVKLVTSDGKTVPMTSLLGESSSTYAYVTMLFWLNFPGVQAATRTSDRNPVFLITTEQEPRSRFFVVRLDVNQEDGDRSLKMGRSGAFSFRAGTAPDSDWTIPYESKEERRGLWRVSVKRSLAPGEYGVFVAQKNELFDFGVD